MQLPTFDLGISHLFPKTRNDFRFLTSFFLLRILFHGFVLIDCMRPSSRALTAESWTPTILIGIAGALHVSWFHGGVRGYIKRQRSLKKGVKVEQKVDEPRVDAAVQLDPNVLDTLPPTSPGEGTPEDSPLMTPYTPSQTPMTLRDSYLFPNISMPTMPNLPTMSIPAIPSLSDITSAFPKSLHTDMPNFGFRDAVKVRWDEQRGMFAGMGTRGRGMALDLGGLGLRRRGNLRGMEEEVLVTAREVPAE